MPLRAGLPEPPSLSAIADSFSRHRCERFALDDIVAVADLSPGLSRSRVFSIQIRQKEQIVRFILKIPNYGSSSRLQTRDPVIENREKLAFEAGLFNLLDRCIATPKIFAIDTVEGATWIWMEDLSDCLNVRWSTEKALTTMRAATSLHETYCRHKSSLAAAPWLAREPHRLFEAHLPEARENLNEIARHPSRFRWLTSRAIADLQLCLEEYDWMIASMRLMPESLAHCDFHPKNLGFLPNGRLLLIDWAQVGLAAAGSDVAIFLSLYRLFGGALDQRSSAFEADLIGVYQQCLAASGASFVPTRADVAQAVWLWAATWGLHLRLGPGLSAVLSGVIQEPGRLDAMIADIVDGADRVLEQIDRLSQAHARRRPNTKHLKSGKT
jgi:hypothetical protein